MIFLSIIIISFQMKKVKETASLTEYGLHFEFTQWSSELQSRQAEEGEVLSTQNHTGWLPEQSALPYRP